MGTDHRFADLCRFVFLFEQMNGSSQACLLWGAPTQSPEEAGQRSQGAPSEWGRPLEKVGVGSAEHLLGQTNLHEPPNCQFVPISAYYSPPPLLLYIWTPLL